MPRIQACSNSPLILKLKFILLPFLRRNRPRQVCLLECISYKKLKKATDGFHRIITCDSQGITYEAKFPDGSVSVVKEVRGTDKGNEVFYKEVWLLGRLCHRHVVALRGYSVGRRSFLVFESTVQGSLKQHLNDPLRTPLSWKTRVQIAIGVAAALEYLQFFCDPPVYHISISTSNIILDEKLIPKLSNIGHLSSEGYQVKPPAPPKERVDLIPQFGTLILELITGQSSVKGSAEVIEWIQESPFSITMDNMIDPDLGNSYNADELKNLVTLARLCIKAEKKSAFSISHVFWYLQKRFGNASM